MAESVIRGQRLCHHGLSRKVAEQVPRLGCRCSQVRQRLVVGRVGRGRCRVRDFSRKSLKLRSDIQPQSLGCASGQQLQHPSRHGRPNQSCAQAIWFGK